MCVSVHIGTACDGWMAVSWFVPLLLLRQVFIGSCMTNIGHFRAAGKLLKQFEGQLPTRLWVAPPTKMDEAQLTAEGYYSIYGNVGARTEMPGCSLCMGNQVPSRSTTAAHSKCKCSAPCRLRHFLILRLVGAGTRGREGDCCVDIDTQLP